MRLARRRAKAAGLNVRFKEGDARKFSVAEGGYDTVLVMGNSFGYFSQEQDDLAVLTSIKRALRPLGNLVIDVTDGNWMRENFERRSWEWIDENHFVCRERSLSTDGDRLISREVVVHAEKGVIADQFYAERLYSLERLQDLLARAGFRNIRFKGEVRAESQRGADLGMMAVRYLVVAQAPVLAAERAGRRRQEPVAVTVIFGDPRLPDPVKRDGLFNIEDLDTIDRFKEAAESLQGYQFRYLDDHGTLMKELRENPPSLVLNLCDEGFDNEPTQELHVPALLEILGIPYTGAGPAALGICYNKAYVGAVASASDIPVPLETYFDPDDQAATMPSVFPALIKPCNGDSSIGITQQAVVHDVEEAVAYPNGLEGDQISLLARITGVADVMESMTSHRPYRPGLGVERALEELTSHRGSRYDADAVEACRQLFANDNFEWRVGADSGAAALTQMSLKAAG
ncbi:MAG: methyltransferase domain-containing protein [Magnetovibrio sp.]|nr:methyltransferase domain-containing protein [Magnetovibrio sp.]